MSIIPAGATLARAPFCDFLNVSFPEPVWVEVPDAVRPLAEQCGLDLSADGLYRHASSGGTIKLRRRNRVGVLSVSGQVLEVMRGLGMFGSLLRLIGERPHRVTLMHATADYVADGPQCFQSAKSAGYSGSVHLSRKAVSRHRVKTFGVFAPDGRETGTVYFGHRANADVWARVYDKRNERIDANAPDPGPLVRVEIAVNADYGVTLRDVEQPDGVFYNVAVPSLVAESPMADLWRPGSLGFVLPPPRSVSPYDRLRSILDQSADVQRLCDLARKVWGVDDAPAELAKLVQRRCSLRSMPGAA